VVAGFAELESLTRRELLAVAHEYMLSGLLGTPGGGPTLASADIDPDTRTAFAIDQWMGASPVYTHRMRTLMGIEGHDVAAIMKALQLDVGFVHSFMDVAYSVRDPNYGEFWLLHCGALMMVEPAGEAAVFNMCHTIEDPTFDATALATNPRARIRPIHRPPRVPADRHPHCHWTIEIDEANEPVGPIPHTELVGALPLAGVPNTNAGGAENGRSADYRGPFRPEFRLRDLASDALAAVTREFHMQLHLLAASSEATIAAHTDQGIGQAAMDEGWINGAWMLGERLARALDLGSNVDGLRRALALTPTFPPGFDRSISVDGDHVTFTLTPVVDGLLDPGHPGLCGSVARGSTGGVEGTVNALGHEAVGLSVEVDAEQVRYHMDLTAADPNREEPVAIAFGRHGIMATWKFDLTEAV
jgi:hypothetical protein